jgi:hypothetical protein
MAFPFNVIEGSETSFTPEGLQKLRQSFIDKLFGPSATIADTLPGQALIADQLAQITRVLGRSATNETTVYDNGSVRSGASSAASSLTLQVERAITQVLGRSPGRGPDGFIAALNSAFPTAKDGQVMMQPARSLVSLHSPITEGATGQLSVEQANLYRQASIIGSDALKVLDGLTPFDPKSDIDAVNALRALVRSQIRSLIDEFGRLDEPRKQRVDTYFKTLLGRDETGLEDGYLYRLGEEGHWGRGETFGLELKVVPVTLEDETQVAGFALLLEYVKTLLRSWRSYEEAKTSNDTIAGRYSDRLSRASIMLPVIADSNANLMSAMDSIAFTQSERRSDSALFSNLQVPTEDPDIPGAITLDDIQATIILPDMTVNDFDEWVDRFTSLEAPSVLSTAGQFGLDFVTDQADTLFWTIGVVLYAVLPQQDQAGRPVSNKNQGKLLGKVLAFERVQQSLSELIYQLDTLASLGVGSISAERTFGD